MMARRYQVQCEYLEEIKALFVNAEPFDWAEGCRPPLQGLSSNLGNNMYANEDNPNLEPVDPKKLAKSLSGSKQGEKSHNHRTNGNERSPVRQV